jgi:hypothetical protein
MEEVQLGMPEHDFKEKVMPSTNNALPLHSTCCTAELDSKDFKSENVEQIDHIDADLKNIALMEQ